MRRREFIPLAVSSVVGSTVAGVSMEVRARRGASEGRGGPEGASSGGTAQGGSGGVEGFRLVGASNTAEMRTYVGMAGGFGLVHPVPDLVTFSLRRYVVECSYPVGSRAWLAIADGDEEGNVVVEAQEGTVPFVKKHRRVIFPRFVVEEGEDVRERARAVYRAVREHGFDDVRGPEHAWRVVHVEYRCPDGVEHVMCGLPMSWDPRLALGVMVRGQIG